MRPDLPKIIFIRHGETDWNKLGKIQGSQGTDLNEKGVAQAQSLAAALAFKSAELLDYDFYVSPQLRAQHTMAIIAAAQDRDMSAIKTDPRLRELEFGEWETKFFYELKSSPIYPADAETLYQWRPKGGESYAEGTARVDAFLSELKRPALIVAHGAIGRCLMALITGMPQEQMVRLRTPQGCYCVLENGMSQWFDDKHQPH